MGVRTRNNMRAAARKRVEARQHEAQDKRIFIHVTPISTCEHVWGGFRQFDDGNGGESFCQKCGLGAMAHSLSQGA